MAGKLDPDAELRRAMAAAACRTRVTVLLADAQLAALLHAAPGVPHTARHGLSLPGEDLPSSRQPGRMRHAIRALFHRSRVTLPPPAGGRPGAS
ncbi:hypothetical protein SAMN05444722_2417 [Rhodovulum sp. ES.010]|uniref:hypothetical protein n=1 Tax=Rhodovulum sp. ES.010 TaxID=1882821 RepID=UPI00092A2FE9|nr:hypothetical protein [Rhodovulum sp. ES.010]SIO47478.1 hypothetical protein SAMN05444722_2417 [Rhodovulum sp. ES.010]